LATEWRFLQNLVDTPSSLQAEDVLAAIEGQALDQRKMGEPAPFWQAGNTVSFQIRRGTQDLQLAVPLVHWTPHAIARYLLDPSRLLDTVGTILLLFVGLFAFLRRSQEPAAQALLIFVAATASMSFSGFIPEDPGVIYYPLAYAGTRFFNYYAFGKLWAPSLLAFTLVFPRPKHFAVRHPWLAYAPFLVGAGVLVIGLATGWWVLGWIATASMLLLSLISLGHSALTMKDAVSRAQLLWAFGGLGLGIALFMLNFTSAFNLNSTLSDILSNLAALSIPVIGLGLAMAVLRYRLFDIDVIIRRTTSYAILTGILLLVYFGTIVVLQRLLSPLTGNSQAAVVLSTLLIAALFLPLRRRVQDAIDRRFFRQKYDAEQVLEQFAATVRDETDLDALTAELVRVIQETMQPEFVSVWLKPAAAERTRPDESDPVAQGREPHVTSI
jgi:hypothetical protein